MIRVLALLLFAMPAFASSVQTGLIAFENEDYQTAFYHLSEARKEKHPTALFALGTMYAQGLGVMQDYDRARQLFTEAAELAHAPSLVALASFYEQGIGGRPDEAKAFALYMLAADKLQYPLAQYRLGLYYRRGQAGIPRDNEEAFKWFRRAAEGNVVDAFYELGVMYGLGLGIARDAKLAERWLGQAYQAGHPAAGIALDNIKSLALQATTPPTQR